MTRRQLRTVDLMTSLLVLAVLASGYCTLAVLVDHWLWPGGLGTGMRFFALIGLISLVAAVLIFRILPPLFHRINTLYAAQTIEESAPGMKNSLLNWVCLQREQPSASDDRLQNMVLAGLGRSAAEGIEAVPPEYAVDRSRIVRLGFVLVGILAFLSFYAVLSPKSSFSSMGRIMFPLADIERPTRVSIKEVTPGDVTLLRGESVTIQAEVRDLGNDETVFCYFSTPDGRLVDQAIPMTVPEDEYRYQCVLPPAKEGIQETLIYYVGAGDARSQAYRATVRPAPAIAVEAIEYDYPDYTGMPNKRVEQSGDIRALEGTQITILAEANVPIKEATLNFDGEERFGDRMSVDGTSATARLMAQLDPEAPSRPWHESYQIRFTDEEGNTNDSPVRHRIEVLADLPPEIGWIGEPASTVDVPLDGQLELGITARDPDFGLRAVRIVLQRDGQPLPTDPLLNEPWPQPFEGRFLFEPLKHGLAQGDQIECWAEATDVKLPDANQASTEKIWINITAPERPTETQTGEDGTEGEGPQNDQQDPKQEAPEGTADQGQPKEGQEGEEGGEEGQDSGQDNGEREPSEDQGEGSEKQEGTEGTEQGEPQPGDQGEKQPPSDQANQAEEQTPGEPGEQEDGGEQEQVGGESQENGTGAEQGEPGASQQTEKESTSQDQGTQGDSTSEPNGGTPEEGTKQPSEGPGNQTADGTSKTPAAEEGGAHGDSADRNDGSQDENGPGTGEQHPDEGPLPREGGGAQGTPEETQGSGEQEAGTDQVSESKGREEPVDGDTQPGDVFETVLDRMKEKSKGEHSDDEELSLEELRKALEQAKPEESGEQKQPANAYESIDGNPNEAETTDKPLENVMRKDGHGEKTDEKPQAEAIGPSSDQSEQPGDPSDAQADKPGASDQPATENGEGAPDSQPGEPSPSGDASDAEAPEGVDPSGAGGQPGSQPSDAATDQPDPEKNDPTGKGTGGKPGDQTSQEGAAEDLGSEEANREFTEQAVDLALRQLEDVAQDPSADQELLDRLGWTQDDARRFVEQWRKMQADAQNSGETGEEAKRELDDALHSLGGLRPRGSRIDSSQRTDDRSGAIESRQYEPPPFMREALEAYTRGTASGG